MKIFVPLNKHLVIEKIKSKKEEQSLVSLPEDYVKKTTGRYIPVRFISSSIDCDKIYEDFFDCENDIMLAVDQTMIEEVIINNVIYLIVHQNYVVGVMETNYETN